VNTLRNVCHRLVVSSCCSKWPTQGTHAPLVCLKRVNSEHLMVDLIFPIKLHSTWHQMGPAPFLDRPNKEPRLLHSEDQPPLLTGYIHGAGHGRRALPLATLPPPACLRIAAWLWSIGMGPPICFEWGTRISKQLDGMGSLFRNKPFLVIKDLKRCLLSFGVP